MVLPYHKALIIGKATAHELYQTQKVRLTLSNLLSLLGVVLAQVFRVTLIFGNGISKRK